MSKKYNAMAQDLKIAFDKEEILDERSLTFLLNALDKANLPDFDYLEFKKFLSALNLMEMDEPTAYKSAFATSATLGLTKERLIDSSNHYLKVLKNEKSNFDDALKKQINQKILAQQEKAKSLDQQIHNYRKEMEALQQKIREFESEKQQIEESTAEINDNLQRTKAQFEATLKVLVEQIQKDQETFKRVL